MIRELEPSEFDQVGSIYNLGRADELSTISNEFVLTPWDSDKYIQSVLSDSRIFVYEKSSTIIGFCGIHESKLNWLFVLAEHRRKGVAGSLVRRLMEEYRSLSLTVASSNVVAIKRYKSLGFSITCEFKVEFQGEYVDVMHMSFSKSET